MSIYKGLVPPLSTVPMVNAVAMSAYEFAKRIQGIKDHEVTIRQSLICGMFAGFANSFFLSPVELVKCKLQI